MISELHWGWRLAKVIQDVNVIGGDEAKVVSAVIIVSFSKFGNVLQTSVLDGDISVLLGCRIFVLVIVRVSFLVVVDCSPRQSGSN